MFVFAYTSLLYRELKVEDFYTKVQNYYPEDSEIDFTFSVMFLLFPISVYSTILFNLPNTFSLPPVGVTNILPDKPSQQALLAASHPSNLI
jgi:hypothetical protein